jgi:hypothetical protein
MSKHDLQARPIYHYKRDSIEAHLSIVFTALAVSHRIEHQTGWSIKKFVRTARRYRTVQIRAGQQILTAADPLPEDLRDALAKITSLTVRTNLAEVGAARRGGGPGPVNNLHFAAFKPCWSVNPSAMSKGQRAEG